MAHNGSLWKPDANARAQIRHGQQVFREKGGATQGMSEKAAAAKGRAAIIKRAQDEADRRFGQPHYGHTENDHAG